MSKIITIGRQLGSGGREIGEKLAKKLEIDYYDKKLLEMAAKESGMCEEIIDKYDETGMSSLLYSLAMNPLGVLQNGKDAQPIGTKAQMVVSKLIKELADKGSAVFVGRCADSILCDRQDVINIFITAKMDDRIARIMKRRDISETQAKELINKTDKSRASYYNYYTNQKWGTASNYHLCLDSSFWGIEKSVMLLYQLLTSDQIR